MTITSIEVHLVGGDGPLLAWVSVILDMSFIVRDIRICRVTDGGLTVSMPTKKHRFPCVECRKSITYDARFCPCCGTKQPNGPPVERKFHDIAHPTCQQFREVLDHDILTAYHIQVASAKRLGMPAVGEVWADRAIEVTPPPKLLESVPTIWGEV